MDPQIIVFGPMKLQNELLTYFIGKTTGLRCVRSQEYSFSYITETRPSPLPLILWDCLGVNGTKLRKQHGKLFESLKPACPVAVFNAQAGSKVEIEAIQIGIRGVIYENDPPAILVKGVQAMHKGELWYPRDVLARHFTAAKPTHRVRKKNQSLLTPREKQILKMIAGGAANSEIASDLKISPHTVKTHLYNIYNKIQVPNRLQAALWASKNFN
jgi:DNA-binding NarL/FixJ family response regulator